MGVEPKIGVFLPPQIIHLFIGFFNINHPYWGTPIFGNTHIIPTNSLVEIQNVQGKNGKRNKLPGIPRTKSSRESLYPIPCCKLTDGGGFHTWMIITPTLLNRVGTNPL